MALELYETTTRCHDLPELVPADAWLGFPEADEARVVEAVRARQADGGTCQEKIDGCWCALELDDAGRVASATSRAGLPLRFAVEWIGEQLRPQLRGWTIIGEVVAGTHWASEHRDEHRLPLVHVYALLDRAGRDRSDEVGQKVPWLHHERLVPIRQAARGEDWGGFARDVFAAGGEGVVLRQPTGRWRAKPLLTVDRYVVRVFCEEDRWGTMRLKATVAVCCSAGRRPRYRRTQTVLVPDAWGGDDVSRHVVVLAGASVDERGLVRHARLVDVRDRDDKQPWECVA